MRHSCSTHVQSHSDRVGCFNFLDAFDEERLVNSQYGGLSSSYDKIFHSWFSDLAESRTRGGKNSPSSQLVTQSPKPVGWTAAEDAMKFKAY